MQDAILSGEGGALNSTKYKQLDELLNQTDMYTQFLMEQIDDAGSKDEAAVEAEAEDGKAGNKRKAGKAAAKNAKRQKPMSPTQVCCYTVGNKASFYTYEQWLHVDICNARFCVCYHSRFLASCQVRVQA